MKTSVVLSFFLSPPCSVTVGTAGRKKKDAGCCYLALLSVNQCRCLGQKELATAEFLRTVNVELVDSTVLDRCSQVLPLEFLILLSWVPCGGCHDDDEDEEDAGWNGGGAEMNKEAED